MPRIYTSRNDPVDYCQRCFPSLLRATDLFNHLGDGPDGRGNCFEYDAHHPPYGGLDYCCEECGFVLGDED